MSDVNVIVVGGRLADDVEIVMLPSGSTAGKFRLANNTFVRMDEGGKPVHRTTWIACNWADGRAEKMASVLRKGKHVTVHGALLSFQTPEMKEAKKPPSMFVEVQEVTLAPIEREQAGSAPAPRSAPAAPPGNASAPNAAAPKIYEDNFSF
jgi:single stranded DNA-binding protein